MKKLPTLFENQITHAVHPGMEWILKGEGIATVQMDGNCCAIIDGKLYKRLDAKEDEMPAGAIACCDPDTVTRHWPHWVPVDLDDACDKWLVEALANTESCKEDGTYEAVGPHFQNNPHGLEKDILERHGRRILETVPRDYDGIKNFLRFHNIEGIVFWRDGEPQCKIKRSDFGYAWPAPSGVSGLNDCLLTEEYDTAEDCYHYHFSLTDEEQKKLEAVIGRLGTPIENMLTDFLRWAIKYPQSYEEWIESELIPMWVKEIREELRRENGNGHF